MGRTDRAFIAGRRSAVAVAAAMMLVAAPAYADRKTSGGQSPIDFCTERLQQCYTKCDVSETANQCEDGCNFLYQLCMSQAGPPEDPDRIGATSGKSNNKAGGTGGSGTGPIIVRAPRKP